MGAVLILVLVLGGLVVVAALVVAAMYNGLIGLRNQAKNAWSQIDVQLKRRHDLIPNLMETVKGYMHHERETLESVTKARTAAMQAQGPAEAGPAEQMLTAALGRLMVVVERYPDLKANQNFLALQEELSSTENRIGFARQFYNDQATFYNTRTQTVPANLIAGMFGFQPMTLFEITAPQEREAPKVQF